MNAPFPRVASSTQKTPPTGPITRVELIDLLLKPVPIITSFMAENVMNRFAVRNPKVGSNIPAMTVDTTYVRRTTLSLTSVPMVISSMNCKRNAKRCSNVQLQTETSDTLKTECYTTSAVIIGLECNAVPKRLISMATNVY